MNNKQTRLNELLNSTDGHSLVVDTSHGLMLGTMPGLENFSAAVHPLLPMMDGIVTSPGQAQRLTARKFDEAALLIQADWTNALRGKDFVLPPEKIEYTPLLDPKEVEELGASAMVLHLILGHEEEIETQCIKRLVNSAMEGLKLGMPLVVNVHPVGPRVVLMNKAIELGTSYAIEGGADGVVVSYPGEQSLATIIKMAGGSPVWIKPEIMDADEADQIKAMELGATGFWLDHRLFSLKDPSAVLKSFHSRVHARVVS